MEDDAETAATKTWRDYILVLKLYGITIKLNNCTKCIACMLISHQL